MPNYTRARNAYLEWYSHLLSSPDANVTNSSRGAVELTLELMADRIEGLNDASENLTHATQPYLFAENHAHRATALDSLLYQVEGDLEAANVIWSIIEKANDHTLDDAPEVIFESVRGHQLGQVLRHIGTEMPASIEGIAAPSLSTRSPGVIAASRRPKTLEGAIEDLRFEIHDTMDVIVDRANNIGIRLVRDVVNMSAGQWSVVLKAIDLLQGNEKAGDIGWGLEDEVEDVADDLAGELRTLLVNVTEKILLVIEKNDLIRYTIADWLEDLRDAPTEKQKQRFSNLLEQLYQTKNFKERDLDVWLHDAVDIANIHLAADEIMQLGNNFDRLTNQIRRLSGLIGVSTMFGNPLLVSVGFALQIGLLGTLVFAGYDHLDEGARALNITQGIKEVLITRIPVSRQTIQRADSLRRRAIRP